MTCCGSICCAKCTSADDLYEIAENYVRDARNAGINSKERKKAMDLADKYFSKAAEKGHEGADSEKANYREYIAKNDTERSNRLKGSIAQMHKEQAEQAEYERQHPEVPILRKLDQVNANLQSIKNGLY